MRLQLSQISTLVGCTPLVGALVDMWHCDALGVYSDISAQNSRGQRFLRGYHNPIQLKDVVTRRIRAMASTPAEARSLCCRSVHRAAATTGRVHRRSCVGLHGFCPIAA
jgi:hypothetical protein